MKKTLTAAAVLLALGGQQAIAKPEGDRNGEFLNKAAVSASAKLDFNLQHRMRVHQKGGDATADIAPGLAPVVMQEGDMVSIDAVTDGSTAQLLADLTAMGLVNGASYGRIVSGMFPVARLAELDGLNSVRYARQSIAVNNVGAVTSRGDVSMGSDVVRAVAGVDGSGVEIGVISDSYDVGFTITTAADDIASGDLPDDVDVLLESPFGGIDEGRAMMQLIHDVAPGADLSFHTAIGGQAVFAQGILDLAANGADVVVDDIIYLAEPMFQDGIIAQAVDTVRDNGVAYFSSAGNNGRDGWVAEGGFVDSGEVGLFGGARHQFGDPKKGGDDLQNFVLGPFASVTFVFQWADPFFSVSGGAGAASDLDIILYQDGLWTGLGSFAFNEGGDAVEIFGVQSLSPEPLELQLGVELFSGPAPSRMKWVAFASGSFTVLDDPTNSGTVYGHANADGAMAVGASAWFNTEAFNPNTIPAFINGFSSAGPTKILFDTSGNSTYITRRRPDFVGPDGTNTTFFASDLSFPVPGTNEPDGFPNFFGTSASAPHVAAVAALALEIKPKLTPEAIRSAFKKSAQDMDDPATPFNDVGYDFGTGSGFVRPDIALQNLKSAEETK